MSAEGYAKLKNEFWRSPKGQKLIRRNRAAGFLYIVMIDYCSDNLTDGFVDGDVMLDSLDATEEEIRFLVDNGFIDETDGGFTVHGYLEHQNSRDRVESQREKDRRRKSRASKDVPEQVQSDSERIPDGFRADSERNPKPSARNVKPKHKTKTQNQITSSNDEGEADASPALDEHELIDLWEPSPACEGTNTEMQAKGCPKVDVPALADEFRSSLHAKGLANYGYRPDAESLDYAFRNWIRKRAESLRERQPPTMTGQLVQAERKHTHSWRCSHVLDMLHRTDDQMDPAPCDETAQQAARLLNQGLDEMEALERLGLVNDGWVIA